MRPPNRSRSLLFALIVAATTALAGCVQEAQDDPFSSGGTGPDVGPGTSPPNEISIIGTATPGSPLVAGVAVTDETSSVTLDISVTNMAGALQTNATNVTEPAGDDADDDLVGGEVVGEGRPDDRNETAGEPLNATVVVWMGGEDMNGDGAEEIYNETFMLAPEGEGVLEVENAVQISQRFNGEVLDRARLMDEPNRAIRLLVYVDNGEASVNGYFRSNMRA